MLANVSLVKGSISRWRELSRGKSLTEEEIKQLEIDLDVWLPPDYRAFLARCTGGTTTEKIDYYPVPIEFTEYCLEYGVDPIVLHPTPTSAFFKTLSSCNATTLGSG